MKIKNKILISLSYFISVILGANILLNDHANISTIIAAYIFVGVVMLFIFIKLINYWEIKNIHKMIVNIPKDDWHFDSPLYHLKLLDKNELLKKCLIKNLHCPEIDIIYEKNTELFLLSNINPATKLDKTIFINDKKFNLLQTVKINVDSVKYNIKKNISIES